MSLILALATLSSVYDCTVTPPRRLSDTNGSPTYNRINIPQFSSDDWRFRIILGRDRNGPSAVVTWRANPMQIAGRFAALPTSAASYAFTAFSAAPCLFTEGPCMSLVHVVDQSSTSATVSISPAALATMPEGRVLWHVVIEGTCTRTETNR